MIFRPTLKFIVFWAIVSQLLILANDAFAVAPNPIQWRACEKGSTATAYSIFGGNYNSPAEVCAGRDTTLSGTGLKQSTLRCSGGQTNFYYSCVDRGSTDVEAVPAVSQNLICPSNSSGFNGSSCTCATTHPYDLGTSCSATPPACGSGQEWVGGASGSCQAQCGADQVRRPEGCTAKPNCLAFEVYDPGTNTCEFKGCPEGYYQTPLLSTNPNETRQTCLPNVQCGSDAVTGNGSCTCRDSSLSYDYMQNKCIIPQTGGGGTGGSGGTGGTGGGTGGSGGTGGTGGGTGGSGGTGGTGGGGGGSGGIGSPGSGGSGTNIENGGGLGSQSPGTQDPPQPVDESNTKNPNSGCVNPYDCVSSVPYATVGSYNVGSNWSYSMWGGSASCPANKTYQLSKTVFTVSYQPVCSGLSMLRPILLIAATVLGVYIIIGFNKGT